VGKERASVTPAVRALREHGVEFIESPYRYVEKGGTAVSAQELGVDEHSVVKTLVMEDEEKHPLIVLMHGDREVSTKEMARLMGVKRVSPCTPETAHRHTGYMVGGHFPVRRAQGDAYLHGGDHTRPSADLHQWRAEGFSRRS